MFLPLMSFGQVITFEDLKSITDKQQFQRFFIERNYQRFEDEEFVEEILSYAYNLKGKGKDIKCSSYAKYFVDSRQFSLAFTSEWAYNNIFDVAKEDLEFVNVTEDDYAIYRDGDFVIFFKIEQTDTDDNWYTIRVMYTTN